MFTANPIYVHFNFNNLEGPSVTSFFKEFLRADWGFKPETFKLRCAFNLFMNLSKDYLVVLDHAVGVTALVGEA